MIQAADRKHDKLLTMVKINMVWSQLKVSELSKDDPIGTVEGMRIRGRQKVRKYSFNPTALRKAKIVYNFGLSECNRVKEWLCQHR